MNKIYLHFCLFAVQYVVRLCVTYSQQLKNQYFFRIKPHVVPHPAQEVD